MLNLWARFPRLWRARRNEAETVLAHEKEWILKEIREAHLEWTTAQYRLEYAVDKEQIDYAIFLLEAAEQRYGILLKEAKRNKVYCTDYTFTKRMAGGS